MKLRKELTKLQNSYNIGKGMGTRLEADTQYILSQNERFMDLSLERDRASARAQAFSQFVQLVKDVKTGGFVSGSYVYTMLDKLRIVTPGSSLEENKESFDHIFDNLVGDEKKIEEFKKISNIIFESTLDYLERDAFIAETNFAAQISVTQKAIDQGQISPVKASVKSKKVKKITIK